MTNDQPTPERIMRLATGYWATGLLGAAASLSVFDHLDAGADTADQVAARPRSPRGAPRPSSTGSSLSAWSSCATARTATPPKPPPSWSRAGLPA